HMAFSPDGRTLTTAARDQTVQVWTAADPRRELDRADDALDPHRSAWCVAVTADGRRLAVGGGQVTRVWDAVTRRRLAARRAPEGLNTGQVRAVRFSPDGRRLLTATNDGVLTLWDEAFRADRQLPHVPGVVVNAGFSADGRRVVVETTEVGGA